MVLSTTVSPASRSFIDMFGSFVTTLTILVWAFAPPGRSHGFVTQIIIGNDMYPGAEPGWVYEATEDIAPTPAWFSFNQDADFVDSGSYQNHAITCHKGGNPGEISAKVEAGSQVTLRWKRWPQEHHGLVLDYLAKCTGPCTGVSSSGMRFFKIAEDGLHNGTAPADGIPGVWATNKLIDQNYYWSTTIPSNIEPGYYVLRHEVVSLHQAFELNGAQHYPQCFNLEVSNSGGLNPCAAGADCRKGTELYDSYHPGVLINIFHGVPNYTLPGPAVWAGLEIPNTPAVFPAVDQSKTKQGLYDQCGGLRYTGPTECGDGLACIYINDWAWHCA